MILSQLLLIIQLLFLTQSFKISTIPPQGPPPPLLYSSASVYDELTNCIIIIGGINSETNTETSEIHRFNLTSNKWDEILPESEFVPSGFSFHSLTLAYDRVIYVFLSSSGSRFISNLLTFDLKRNIWETKQLTGEIISGRKQCGFVNFNYQNINYVAIIGGYDNNGYDSSLYL